MTPTPSPPRPPRRPFRRGLPLRTAALLLVLLPLLLGTSLRGAPIGDGGDGVNVVRYYATDALSSWSGEAPIGALELIVDPDDLTTSTLRVTVPADRFDSGNFVRDANARRAVFEAGSYPEIVFEARATLADPATLPDGVRRQVTLRGELTLHGITREVTSVATVLRDGDRLQARGELSVLLSEFEMRRPSFLGVTVNDLVRVEYAVAAALSPVDP